MTTTDVNSATYKLGHAPIGQLLRTYAIPAVVGTMVNSLYNIVDRIFIGHGVGPLAISGLAVTFPIFLFLQAFGILVGAGASARISIYLGQRNHEDAERLLGNALMLSLLLSSSAILVCYLFMDQILLSFGASVETLKYAREYLEIALPGNIFANLCFSYNNVMRASGYPKKAMTTMLIGAILNTILDPIFIFGFGMGIRGAAVATVLSMFIGMCYVMQHFVNRESLIRIRSRYFKLQKRYVLGILSIGMAPFAIQLTSSSVSVILNTSLQHYGGDYAVGAYGVQNSFAMIVVMLMLGVSQGMQPIVGYNYGAGNMDRVKHTVRLSATINFLIGAVGTVLALTLPHFISRAFTKDLQMEAVTEVALRISLFVLWGVGYQITITQFFQSIGKALKAMVLSLTRQVFFLIPLLLFLPHFFQINGVWMAMPIADFLAFAFALYMYNNYKRKMDRQALLNKVSGKVSL